MTFTDHSFHDLALINDLELFDKLKREHLTPESTQQVPLATGVLPHIDHAVAFKKVFDICMKIDLKLDSHN